MRLMFQSRVGKALRDPRVDPDALAIAGPADDDDAPRERVSEAVSRARPRMRVSQIARPAALASAAL